MELKQEFGERLRFLRRFRNVTQEHLAESIGRSETFVRMIERGESAPSFETLTKLTEALDVDIIELFQFDETPPKRRKQKER